jgi:hypothetical protein
MRASARPKAVAVLAEGRIKNGPRGVDRALTPVPPARGRSLKEHLQGLLVTHIGPRQSRRTERNYPTDIPNPF